MPNTRYARGLPNKLAAFAKAERYSPSACGSNRLFLKTIQQGGEFGLIWHCALADEFALEIGERQSVFKLSKQNVLDAIAKFCPPSGRNGFQDFFSATVGFVSGASFQNSFASACLTKPL
jgi:hypothetical protein